MSRRDAEPAESATSSALRSAGDGAGRGRPPSTVVLTTGSVVERAAGPGPSRSPDEAPVLVTGANGQIGRRLLERLASAANAPPRALVRSERAARAVRAALPSLDFELRIADYADVAALRQALVGCRCVVHLVGLLREGRARRYRDAHEGSTAALLQVAGEVGVERIVYLSVLGADPAAANPCLASKGRAETLLLEAPIETVVIRLPMVLGPEQPAGRALRRWAEAPVVALVRGGRSIEQPIDEEDVLDAITSALRRAGATGRVLELAGPEALARRHLVRRAALLLGRNPRIVPIPWAAAWAAAAFCERVFADPPLTRAMLGVLERDDRVDPGPACAVLGLALRPLEATLRRCLFAEAR